MSEPDGGLPAEVDMSQVPDDDTAPPLRDPDPPQVPEEVWARAVAHAVTTDDVPDAALVPDEPAAAAPPPYQDVDEAADVALGVPDDDLGLPYDDSFGTTAGPDVTQDGGDDSPW